MSIVENARYSATANPDLCRELRRRDPLELKDFLVVWRRRCEPGGRIVEAKLRLKRYKFSQILRVNKDGSYHKRDLEHMLNNIWYDMNFRTHYCCGNERILRHDDEIFKGCPIEKHWYSPIAIAIPYKRIKKYEDRYNLMNSRRFKRRKVVFDVNEETDKKWRKDLRKIKKVIKVKDQMGVFRKEQIKYDDPKYEGMLADDKAVAKQMVWCIKHCITDDNFALPLHRIWYQPGDMARRFQYYGGKWQSINEIFNRFISENRHMIKKEYGAIKNLKTIYV